MSIAGLVVSARYPRVLIVEDHEIVAQTLALALRLSGFEEVQTADDLTPDGIARTADEFRPEVVLLDLHLDAAGPSVPMIGPLSARGARVLVLTATRDRSLLAECLEAGAAGLFDKVCPFDQLVNLITDAALGHTLLKPAARDELLACLRAQRADMKVLNEPFTRLSKRERDVLHGLIDGRTAEEIATAQFVSVTTVRSQIRAILQKLGVNSQLAAVALVHRAHWDEAGLPTRHA